MISPGYTQLVLSLVMDAARAAVLLGLIWRGDYLLAAAFAVLTFQTMFLAMCLQNEVRASLARPVEPGE